ncbi:transposase [Salicibibacter cibarius]|uniref:Transposase n=1 Tax=Salicibibacter cibarius TaxID=2743000 RepID=A0A7T7C9U7_9BACI|nr:transposase [Salicibibacter cibarius]QQK74237.1 transposase [Salicibibacter cibarius]
MEPNILRRIFFDHHHHWEQFVEKHGDRIRPVVHKEVEKFRDCGNPENGFKLFVCEGCHETRKVPYRCKGRFCTTCSIGESEEWSRLLMEDVFQVNHRHVILTIDEGLREVFLLHRELLKMLMDEGARLLKEYFEKKKKVTPGIIAGLHTFGSQVNFNPHIHMLVTMGGMTKKGEWKAYDFIPFQMLRKQWQTVVLKLIRKHLSGKDKKRVQARLQQAFSKNGEGFYIYAPKQRGEVQDQLRYIGRYMRRPAIGINRIEAYDGQMVTFKYHDKVDGKEKYETISVEVFIMRLIRHIPDEQFKTIRHYGLYSRRTKNVSKKLLAAWQKTKKTWITQVKRTPRRQTWRERVIASGHKGPLRCPKCDNYFEYKGEVCLENGRLVVKVALGETARSYLEREIGHVPRIETPKKETKKEEETTDESASQDRQLCLFTVS